MKYVVKISHQDFNDWSEALVFCKKTFGPEDKRWTQIGGRFIVKNSFVYLFKYEDDATFFALMWDNN